MVFRVMVRVRVSVRVMVRVRIRVRFGVRFRVRVRVIPFSRSREVRFWTRPENRNRNFLWA